MPISPRSKPSMALDTATATPDRGQPPKPVSALKAAARLAWRLARLAGVLLAQTARALPLLLRLLLRELNRLWRRLRRLPWVERAVEASARPWRRLCGVPGIATLIRFYRRISPLTRSILGVNVFALAVLGGGFLYLGQYQDGLIAAQIDALKTQGEIFAAAVGEGAAVSEQGGTNLSLVPNIGSEMIRHLDEPTVDTRARLYNTQGELLADTRLMRGGPGGLVQVSELPPPNSGLWERMVDGIYGGVVSLFPNGKRYPPYTEKADQAAADYPEVMRALSGDIASVVQSDRENGGLVITVAVPVQRYRQVLGAVQLSTGSADI